MTDWKEATYLKIQTVIGHKMNECNHILISNTDIFPSWKQLFLCLLSIFIIYNNKVEF